MTINLKDYLYILNGAIIVDLIFIYLSNTNVIKINTLKKWYRVFKLSAFFIDILFLVIILVLAKLFYYFVFTKYNFVLFILLSVIIQMIYDLSFYAFFSSVKRGSNRILDLFQDYAKEVGYKVLLIDSTMIIFTCLFASLLANLSINMNIFLLIILFYLAQYFIYN